MWPSKPFEFEAFKAIDHFQVDLTYKQLDSFSFMLLLQAANAKLENEVKNLRDRSRKLEEEIKEVSDAYTAMERERNQIRADLAAEKKVSNRVYV